MAFLFLQFLQNSSKPRTKPSTRRLILQAVAQFCLLTLIWCDPSARAQTPDPLGPLILAARNQHLDQDPYWLLLLHYKRGLYGLRSLVDDPRFFLSPAGKTHSDAEMEATLRLFFNTAPAEGEPEKCRFVARLAWLKEKLKIPDSRLSDLDCLEFHKWMKTISPQSAVLIFPSFYMNNPASMFGHTLIRIDSKSESKLLSYAINYSARVDTFDWSYPVKGVFGVFKGYFGIDRYYDVIRHYNDTEQRDIWEYPLNLSREEIERMFLHLWELREIYSYYFYFDENCSYSLLLLLDSARPSLHLSDTAGLWVLPTDTLRAVRENGLANPGEFRPSKATRIRAMMAELDGSALRDAILLSRGQPAAPRPDRSDSEDRKILDLAIEEIQYRFNTRQISRDNYMSIYLPTLKQRSALGSLSDESEIPVSAPPQAPEEGHRSQRLTLGGGVDRSQWFEAVSYRPGYHGFDDPDAGYDEGLQIVFGDTTLRHYRSEILRLEHLDLIDIFSVSPLDRFFKPISFKIQTGLSRDPDLRGNDALFYRINPGFGAGAKLTALGLLYALLEADLRLGTQYNDFYALGAGVQVGVIQRISNRWKINFFAENLNYGFRDYFRETSIAATQALLMTPANTLTFSLSADWVKAFSRRQAQLSWNYYF